MSQEPVRISRLQTQLVLALLVSESKCLSSPLDCSHLCPATSVRYEDNVTLCPDGSYCCGNNNTACCRSNGGNLEIFYGNPGPIPFAVTSLADYYASLHIPTKSRPTTYSSSPSSTHSHTAAIASTFPTASTTSTSSSVPADSPTMVSHIPISSTPTAPPTLSAANTTENAGLSENTKIVIGTVTPVAILGAGFVAWWLFGRRRRSSGALSPHDDDSTRHFTGVDLPPLHPPGELPSGVDRAELVTRQWGSAELPSRSHVVELAARS